MACTILDYYEFPFFSVIFEKFSVDFFARLPVIFMILVYNV